MALSLMATARYLQVVTHSSGNHAQAVAKVASMLGLKAYIVMPENSAKVKVCVSLHALSHSVAPARECDVETQGQRLQKWHHHHHHHHNHHHHHHHHSIFLTDGSA